MPIVSSEIIEDATQADGRRRIVERHTAAWTESLGTEKPQKITQAITGGSAGLHKVKLCVARSSATNVYAEPDVTVN